MKRALSTTILISGLVAGLYFALLPARAGRQQQPQEHPAIDYRQGVSNDAVARLQRRLDDGDIMTAGGILAWADLGLTLVDRLMGPSVMLATARFLLVEPPRQQQRPYSRFVPRFTHGDEAVLRVQHHLHATPPRASNIGELAEMAGLGARTFLRRFVKATGLRPTEYVQQLRIVKAREALELTKRSVDQIAWQVGYQDPTAFRKVFHRITGLTPNAYRQRFGVA